MRWRAILVDDLPFAVSGMIPRRLVEWVLIRAMVQTIGDSEEVPVVPAMTVLERWSKRQKGP